MDNYTLGDGHNFVFNGHKKAGLLDYQLFKIFSFISPNRRRGGEHYTEEPLVYDGLLDISGVSGPALSRVLVSSGMVTLWQLVNITGTDLSPAEDWAVCMGLHSLCVVHELLHCLITSEPRVQLMDCKSRETSWTDTLWRSVQGFNDDTKPEWTALTKNLLSFSGGFYTESSPRILVSPFKP